MKPDLKQRLTSRIFKVTVSFLIGIINCVQAQTDLSKDSVRRVEIRVTAKEKAVNYDSIFQQSIGITNSEKAPRAEKTVKTNIRAGNRVPKPAAVSKPLAPREEKAAVKTVSQEKQAESAAIRQTVPAASNNPKTDTAVSIPAVKPAASSAATHAEAVENHSSLRQTEQTAEHSIKQNPSANKISYLWIGFVLVIGGIVLGLIFGRTAFMVSVAGIIFLIIGFYAGR